MKRLCKLTCLLAVLISCSGPSGKGGENALRQFPVPKIPGVVSEPSDRAAYLASHYWDGFFDGKGLSDSSALLGVANADLQHAMADYCGLLENTELKDAQAAVSSLFDKMESRHAADTSIHLYERFNELLIHYLYDPNSPMRNEDLYLPYVQKLASSPWTGEDMRTAYGYEAKMCALNRYGEKAPDFRYKTVKGRTGRLYGISADYILLFFSNPGCKACKEITEEVMGRPYMEGFIKDGKVAVMNIYIDEDLPAWRSYVNSYPSDWYNGYDPDLVIRNDRLYHVRAIPSLYLLDREKRILMKDAPTEKVMAFLDGISTQNK